MRTAKSSRIAAAPDELTDAMNAGVQIPGLNNAWTMPIKTRIDMLATGIKTPVGIKVAGPDLAELERIASEIEAVVRQVPGTSSAFAERSHGRQLHRVQHRPRRDRPLRPHASATCRTCSKSRSAACR